MESHVGASLRARNASLLHHMPQEPQDAAHSDDELNEDGFGLSRTPGRELAPTRQRPGIIDSEDQIVDIHDRALRHHSLAQVELQPTEFFDGKYHHE